jgi:hypothetical protein
MISSPLVNVITGIIVPYNEGNIKTVSKKHLAGGDKIPYSWLKD